MVKNSTLKEFHQQAELINEAMQNDKAQKEAKKITPKLPKTAPDRFEIEL